jgi:hypothetical protein
MRTLIAIGLGLWVGYMWGDASCAKRWKVLSDPSNWRATHSPSAGQPGPSPVPLVRRGD